MSYKIKILEYEDNKKLLSMKIKNFTEMENIVKVLKKKYDNK